MLIRISEKKKKTNNARDILDVSSDTTSLSDQNIVGIKLGNNALANQDKGLLKTYNFFPSSHLIFTRVIW